MEHLPRICWGPIVEGGHVQVLISADIKIYLATLKGEMRTGVATPIHWVGLITESGAHLLPTPYYSSTLSFSNHPMLSVYYCLLHSYHISCLKTLHCLFLFKDFPPILLVCSQSHVRKLWKLERFCTNLPFPLVWSSAKSAKIWALAAGWAKWLWAAKSLKSSNSF